MSLLTEIVHEFASCVGGTSLDMVGAAVSPRRSSASETNFRPEPGLKEEEIGDKAVPSSRFLAGFDS